MDLRVLIMQLSSLFIVMILGIVVGKLRLVGEGFSRDLSSLLLNIVVPCLILGSVTSSDVGGKSDLRQAFVAATLLYIALPIFGFITSKVIRANKPQGKVYIYMTTFSNGIYIGFPLISSLFGEGAIFYASIFVIYFNALNYSFGAHLMDQNHEGKRSLKSIINPGLVASILAIVLFITGFKVPEILQITFSSIGSISTPLALIITGLNIANFSIKGIFGDKKVYWYSIIRQILMPLILFPIIRMFVTSYLIQGILLIMLTMPVAMAVILFANQYDTEIQLATSGVFITTILSYVTIPLMAYIFM